MHIAFQIIADDTDVTARFQDRLVQLTITDEAGHKSDTAEIVIDDRDYLVALPETGAKLEIALGFPGELVTIGTYVVDDPSGTVAPDTMTIGARAADMPGGIRARKTRSWHNVTIRDIVGRIAGAASAPVGAGEQQGDGDLRQQLRWRGNGTRNRLCLPALGFPAAGRLGESRRLGTRGPRIGAAI